MEMSGFVEQLFTLATKLYGLDTADSLLDKAEVFASQSSYSTEIVLDKLIRIANRRGIEFVLSHNDYRSLLAVDFVMINEK